MCVVAPSVMYMRSALTARQLTSPAAGGKSALLTLLASRKWRRESFEKISKDCEPARIGASCTTMGQARALLVESVQW